MKLAMFGTGWFANQHLQLLSAEAEVEIVGHVATTRPKAESAAKKWGGRAYTSTEELLANEKVEAAWICVPPVPAVHQAIEPLLIAQHIPFFVEKPLSADLPTAESIGAAVASSQLITAVGYHWRAMDTLAQVQNVIAANPVRLVVGSWYGDTPAAKWWQKQASSGGQVIEQATHLFDLARFLLGEAQVIEATSDYFARPNLPHLLPDLDVAGVNTALLRFETKASGVFSTTCILEAAQTVQLQLICEGLSITITSSNVTYDTGKQQQQIASVTNPYLTEDRAFLQAVKQQNQSLVFSSYGDALHTQRLCCAIVAKSNG